jgi:hypothetical protein
MDEKEKEKESEETETKDNGETEWEGESYVEMSDNLLDRGFVLHVVHLSELQNFSQIFYREKPLVSKMEAIQVEAIVVGEEGREHKLKVELVLGGREIASDAQMGLELFNLPNKLFTVDKRRRGGGDITGYNKIMFGRYKITG